MNLLKMVLLDLLQFHGKVYCVLLFYKNVKKKNVKKKNVKKKNVKKKKRGITLFFLLLIDLRIVNDLFLS